MTATPEKNNEVSAMIPVGTITGYELQFDSEAYLTINGIRTEVELVNPDPFDAPFLGIEVSSGDFITTIFELDLDDSRLEEENGVLVFYPEFEVSWE